MRTRTAARAASAVAAVSAVLAGCGTGPLAGPPASPARPGHRAAVLVKQARSGAAKTAAPCRRLSTPPGGPIIIGGAYSGVLISWDGGRTWHGAPTVDRSMIVGGGTGVTATMTDSQDGYAIAVMSQIWLTHDAGHTWTPVTIH